MHQRLYLKFVALLVGSSQLIRLESFGRVHKGSYLSFPCLYDHCSRAKQLKVKRHDAIVFTTLGRQRRQIERYLGPDIVLTRNGEGRGGDQLAAIPGVVRF